MLAVQNEKGIQRKRGLSMHNIDFQALYLTDLNGMPIPCDCNISEEKGVYKTECTVRQNAKICEAVLFRGEHGFSHETSFYGDGYQKLTQYKGTVGNFKTFTGFSDKGQNKHMHYGYATSKNIEGPYTMCDEPKMDNIHYIEDATAFQQNGKTYLLTTDNFGKNSGLFGAGILWEMKDGYFKRENAKIGFGVLSDYTELPNGTTFYDNDRSTKLERPGILVKNGRPEYLYGCTRADVLGSGKSQCYVFKIKNTNAF